MKSNFYIYIILGNIFHKLNSSKIVQFIANNWFKSFTGSVCLQRKNNRSVTASQ